MLTRFRSLITGLLVLCSVCSASVFAQTKPEEKKTATAVISAPSERSRTMKELDFTWKRAKKWTLDYVDAMPEESLNFKPTPEIRSFAEQLLHLSYWNYGLLEGVTGKPNPFGKDEKEIEKKSEYKAKAALRKVVEQSYDNVIAATAQIDETKLPEQIAFFNSKVTRLFALATALDHQAHH
nr:DinB family protein [Acidobacteriota bacterium]